MGVPTIDWNVPGLRTLRSGSVTEDRWEAWPHKSIQLSRSLSSLPFGFPQQNLDVAVTHPSVTFHPGSGTAWKIFPVRYNRYTL